MADSDSSSSRETTPVPVTSGMREPKSISVEIVSDTICPFCFLGEYAKTAFLTVCWQPATSMRARLINPAVHHAGYKKILAAIDQVKLEAKQYNLPLSFS